MNRLDQFLSSAARQMRLMPAAARADELRELRGHLEQRAQDFEDAGMSADEAQLRATESLGSARALGSRLCDAWEGVPFSWWRLAAAVAGVTAFLLFGIAFVILALVTVPLKSETTLLPEITPALYGLYIALPLFCGLIFSHWLGRRGRLVAGLYFLAFAIGDLRVTFPKSGGFETPPASIIGLINSAGFGYLWVALAIIGAWIGYSWRIQKRHQLAFVGTNVSPPKSVLWIPLNLKWWRNAFLLMALLGALYTGRVWLQFHPQTSQATLANY